MQFPSVNFGLSQNCRKFFSLSENLGLKMQNLNLKLPALGIGNLEAKLRF